MHHTSGPHLVLQGNTDAAEVMVAVGGSGSGEGGGGG